MKVSIVILTYKRESIVTVLIEELYKLKLVEEIILVDNGASDSLKKLEKSFSKLVYLEGDNNKGTASRNLGIKKSVGEIIICIDDDISGLTDISINSLIMAFAKDEAIGAICFKVLNGDGQISNWCHHCESEIFSEQSFNTYEISEGAVAFRKDTIEKSGLFPEEFFLSHEGLDLSLRIINAGYYIIYSPQIEVLHSHATSGRTGWRRYYYDTRNIFLVWARNLPFWYGIKYAFKGLFALLVYSFRDGYLNYYFKGFFEGYIYFMRNSQKTKISMETILYMKECEANKPSLIYFIKKRLFRKGVAI